jgi:hypothetical protein
MEKYSEKLAKVLDFFIFGASIVAILAWVVGKPLLYDQHGPVMSIFTAISLFMIVGIRLATRYLYLWPFTMSIAFLLIVGGGNFSSLLMLLSAPTVHIKTSSSLVMTSIFTSLGIVLFCIYEILVYLRKTPKNVFILDDILIHLALVPGELSLIGHIFNNPTYLSMGIDPRVGISILEMCFMAALAASTVFGNKNLFLWQFLKGGVGNQVIFCALFANQYIAPLLYLSIMGKSSDSFGTELFIMFAGVLATLGFLVIQAYGQNKDFEVVAES